MIVFLIEDFQDKGSPRQSPVSTPSNAMHDDFTHACFHSRVWCAWRTEINQQVPLNINADKNKKIKLVNLADDWNQGSNISRKLPPNDILLNSIAQKSGTESMNSPVRNFLFESRWFTDVLRCCTSCFFKFRLVPRSINLLGSTADVCRKSAGGVRIYLP